MALLFDWSAWRLRGIRSWQDLTLLGRGNLERLLALAQERVAGAVHGQSLERQELDELGVGVERLNGLVREAVESKPVLPRLRIEHFRRGDVLEVYLGDSPGVVSGTSWARARAIDVSKAHNPAWVTSEPNSGYYWQITARTEGEVFPGVDVVRFSTSEPRALLVEEARRLRGEVNASTAFAALWCENAWREWPPIWCIQRGVAIDPADVDFARWLREGR
jgi:hypothetical protein